MRDIGAAPQAGIEAGAVDGLLSRGSVGGPRARVGSAARAGCVSLAGHDQFHDESLLTVGAGVELAMDDPPAVVLDLANGPRRRRARISPALFIEGPAEEDDLLAVERFAALAQRHPRLSGVGPDA